MITFRTLLTSIAFLLCSWQASAQIMGAPASTDVNQQLRDMFSTVSPPPSPPPVFYDMAAHFIDKSWYVPVQQDTTTTTVFAIQYDEMYCAHYDTTQFERVDSVFNHANDFGADTVVMGLIYYHYCTLKDSALYDSMYFHIDTLIPQLYDNPYGIGSPYNLGEVFNICLFQDNNTKGSLTYRIDPAFLFIDPVFNSWNGEWRLEVDFDDGNGWHIVSATAVSHHSVAYSTSGQHTVQARVVPVSGGSPMASAMAKVGAPAVTSPPPGAAPDIWTHIPGIEAAVYWPCQVQNEPLQPKFIILLEGFDFSENVSAEDTYNQYVARSGLANLRNYGYTFIVVNWTNSKVSMVDNAMSVVNLVGDLKCNYLDGSRDNAPQHQFVMMGISMGGVIARYALTYMEKNPQFSPCFIDQSHNTRLYVSIDAPHQGAYVPLAFQELYDNVPFTGFPYNIVHRNTSMLHIMHSDAATQLMNLHSITNVNPFANYYEHPNRLLFMAQLQALNPATNGYPEHVKMMAISNGLLTGEHQVGLNDRCLMSPGDDYVDATGDLNMTILGFPVVGLHFALNLKSVNPGQQFYYHELGVNKWGIKLNWKRVTKCLWPFNWPCVTFPVPAGFSIGFVSHTVASESHSAAGIPAYDVMPGGRVGGWDVGSYNLNWGLTGIDPTSLRLTFNWLNGNPVSFCPSQPVVSIALGIGIANLNVNATTQGLNFCFVPLQSALDYSGSVPQDHNIYADPINTKFQRTPFDVIVGEVNDQPGYPQVQIRSDLTLNQNGDWMFPSYNLDHVTLRNHQLTDSVLDNWVIMGNPVGSQPDNWAFAFYLNREIGDEQLFLDNLVLDRNAIIQAEYSIHAGAEQNPYYEYPNQSVAATDIFRNYSGTIGNPYGYNLANNGIFARADAFEVLPGKFAELWAEDPTAITITGSIGRIRVILMPQWVCTTDFSNKKDQYTSVLLKDPVKLSETVVYPNPVTAGDKLYLDHLGAGSHRLQLVSIDGRLIGEETIRIAEGKIAALDISSDIKPGIYFLKTGQGANLQTFKIVVR